MVRLILNFRDWSALFKARFSNEKMLGLQGSPSLPWSIFLAYCIDALRDLPKSNLLFGASGSSAFFNCLIIIIILII
jgi:hypothetical protein